MKPVIEKKRRDRMNHSLEELRTLLMNYTKDTRLRNPKLEKAEILELTVEYLRKRMTGGGRADPVGVGESGTADSCVRKNLADGRQEQDWPFFSPIYMAGYRQCASQLTSFIDCVKPSMRENFMRALGQYQEPQNCSPPWGGQSQTPTGDRPLWFSATEALRSMDDGKSGKSNTSYRRPESFSNSKTSLPFYQVSSVIHHHPWSQPIAPPYPSPPYSISPPPSPCYSNSSSTLNSPPPYLSVPCHFPFSQNLSPLSPDSSSTPPSTSSLPVAAAPTLGPKVSLRPREDRGVHNVGSFFRLRSRPPGDPGAEVYKCKYKNWQGAKQM
ncbi:transcription factor HES-7-like [Arapaima gigas]